MITIEPFALSDDLLVLNNYYNVGAICKGKQDVYYFKIHDEDGNTFSTKDLQTIIDKVNELNNVKPSATIDIKRYAQAIVESCNKYRYSNDDHYDCEHCDECLTDGRAQHKPDCIVLDAQRVLKELEQ